MNSHLTIILPCFNPPSGWVEVVISSIKAVRKEIPQDVALTIVNDCSTVDLSKDFNILKNNIENLTIIDLEENRGKGYALRQGVKSQQSDLYIYTDIDFPYQHESLMEIYKALVKKNDVVAGIKNQAYYAHTPLMRKWISQLLRFSIKKFLKLKISDTQCGLKGFNNLGKEHFLSTKIDRYLFDLEFIHSASKDSKISMQAIEVQLKPNIIFRKMNMKIISQEIKNFISILGRK